MDIRIGNQGSHFEIASAKTTVRAATLSGGRSRDERPVGKQRHWRRGLRRARRESLTTDGVHERYWANEISPFGTLVRYVFDGKRPSEGRSRPQIRGLLQLPAAVLRFVFTLVQIVLMLVLMLLSKLTAARAMNANKSEYSTRSWPSSSIQKFFNIFLTIPFPFTTAIVCAAAGPQFRSSTRLHPLIERTGILS